MEKYVLWVTSVWSAPNLNKVNTIHFVFWLDFKEDLMNGELSQGPYPFDNDNNNSSLKLAWIRVFSLKLKQVQDYLNKESFLSA